MYDEEYAASAAGAAAKVGLLKNNPLGYFLLSALAGAYIGFGVFLAFTVSGTLGPIPMNKIAMGLSFGVALSLVIMAGAELFTGNAFVLFSGWRSKTVSLTDVLHLWVVCYVGNLVGAVILSFLFYGAAGTAGGVGQALATAAATKMSLPPLVLFLRGILCNVLVCLAVWCGFRCKSDSGKLIMTFWCLYAFFTCGFEHSVANMTVLTLGLLNPAGMAVSLAGFGYNLLWVTLGNLVGAVVFLAIPYGIAAAKKQAQSTTSISPSHKTGVPKRTVAPVPSSASPSTTH